MKRRGGKRPPHPWRQRPRSLPRDPRATLPLPLGNPRSSILDDPAARNYPEMRVEGPETDSEPLSMSKRPWLRRGASLSLRDVVHACNDLERATLQQVVTTIAVASAERPTRTRWTAEKASSVATCQNITDPGKVSRPFDADVACRAADDEARFKHHPAHLLLRLGLGGQQRQNQERQLFLIRECPIPRAENAPARGSRSDGSGAKPKLWIQRTAKGEWAARSRLDHEGSSCESRGNGDARRSDRRVDGERLLRRLEAALDPFPEGSLVRERPLEAGGRVVKTHSALRRTEPSARRVAPATAPVAGAPPRTRRRCRKTWARLRISGNTGVNRHPAEV